MKWEVEWSPPAERDVLQLPWRLAARICAAMLALAERGEGALERTERNDTMRLRIRGAVALFRIDRSTRTFYVLRLYASP